MKKLEPSTRLASFLATVAAAAISWWVGKVPGDTCTAPMDRDDQGMVHQPVPAVLAHVAAPGQLLGVEEPRLARSNWPRIPRQRSSQSGLRR